MRKKVGEYSAASDWLPISTENSPKFSINSLADVPVHRNAGVSKEDIKVQFYLPQENIYSPWFTFHDYNLDSRRFRQLVAVRVTLNYLGRKIKDADWTSEESEHSNRDSLVIAYSWEVNREEAPELGEALLFVASLLVSVFLTTVILVGGLAEHKHSQRSRRSLTTLPREGEEDAFSSSVDYQSTDLSPNASTPSHLRYSNTSFTDPDASWQSTISEGSRSSSPPAQQQRGHATIQQQQQHVYQRSSTTDSSPYTISI
jgi:hypothetical protein